MHVAGRVGVQLHICVRAACAHDACSMASEPGFLAHLVTHMSKCVPGSDASRVEGGA